MAAASSQTQAISPPPSPAVAAAIVAALETFMRATAPSAAPAVQPLDRWRRVAMLEAVSSDSDDDVQHPWINT
jgi:hypothetical protein